MSPFNGIADPLRADGRDDWLITSIFSFQADPLNVQAILLSKCNLRLSLSNK